MRACVRSEGDPGRWACLGRRLARCSVPSEGDQRTARATEGDQRTARATEGDLRASASGSPAEAGRALRVLRKEIGALVSSGSSSEGDGGAVRAFGRRSAGCACHRRRSSRVDIRISFRRHRMSTAQAPEVDCAGRGCRPRAGVGRRTATCRCRYRRAGGTFGALCVLRKEIGVLRVPPKEIFTRRHPDLLPKAPDVTDAARDVTDVGTGCRPRWHLMSNARRCRSAHRDVPLPPPPRGWDTMVR